MVNTTSSKSQMPSNKEKTNNAEIVPEEQPVSLKEDKLSGSVEVREDKAESVVPVAVSNQQDTSKQSEWFKSKS